jgi:crotonobetaine/carnitine-CoA ligase
MMPSPAAPGKVSIDPRLSSAEPRVPPRELVVLRYLLEQRAHDRPDEVFAVFAGMFNWTNAATVEAARRAACGLANVGVAQGDRVLSWLPNGPDPLRVWFGTNWLGATYVPINVAYRGAVLEHVIRNSGAKVLVCHSALAERLGELSDLGRLEFVILIGDDAPALPARLQSRPAVTLTGEIVEERLALSRPIEPWDEQSIIYTSGTTGPSKGVLSSYCHSATTAMTCFEGRFGTDRVRYMITLPLFHGGGTLGVVGAMLSGGSIALIERFDTARFWDLVRETGTTCCTLLGAMTTFLLKQPPSARDRDHSLKLALLVPYTDEAQLLRERFGVDTFTVFNMTEISAPLLSEVNPVAAGSCGRVRPGVEVRLVDENDLEVPIGQVGEMMVRADRPWSMNHGYNAMPEATAKAWRNGWFHTGDAFRRDAEGNYFFVDRIKDAIRRRGENISSFEVERECVAYPAVREAAAIAVPSEYAEDEVMVVVAAVAGRVIDPAHLLEFLRPRMAHFMLPRFIRIVAELPKTPTEKVQKALLREQGVTPDSWDREKHGVTIKADRVPAGRQ